MGASESARLTVSPPSQWTRLQTNSMLLILLSILVGAAAQCDQTLQCCAPGSLQLGDPADADSGSFCTHKPFEDGYVLNIGKKVPLQVNLVDYCTNAIMYSTFFAVEMDKFSLVNVPCTYQPVACNLLPTEQIAACQAGQKVWTNIFGCPDTSNSTAQNKSFYQQEIGSRICSSANYCRYSSKTSDNVEKGCTKRTDLLWYDPPVLDIGSPYQSSVGYCGCNWKQLQQRLNVTNVTTGVPDGFIKDGMSTFYVQASGPANLSAPLHPKAHPRAPRPRSPQSHVHAYICPLAQGNEAGHAYSRLSIHIYNRYVCMYLCMYASTAIRGVTAPPAPRHAGDARLCVGCPARGSVLPSVDVHRARGTRRIPGTRGIGRFRKALRPLCMHGRPGRAGRAAPHMIQSPSHPTRDDQEVLPTPQGRRPPRPGRAAHGVIGGRGTPSDRARTHGAAPARVVTARKVIEAALRVRPPCGPRRG